MISLEKKRLKDGSVHVLVAGEVGDSFDASHLLDGDDGARVVMHLAAVRSMTSLGVRAFELFVAGLAVGGREVVLTHVSPAVATQLIMIPTLCAGATIESANLPFRCPSCAAEKSHTIPWRTGAHREHAPTCACGTAMELDGLAEQYLPS
jgi:hypothetical protein